LENSNETVVEKYGTLLRHLAGRSEPKKTTEIQNNRSEYRQCKLESLKREVGLKFFLPPISEAHVGNEITIHLDLKSSIEEINWFACT
jgi:hypothetical protein